MKEEKGGKRRKGKKSGGNSRRKENWTLSRDFNGNEYESKRSNRRRNRRMDKCESRLDRGRKKENVRRRKRR